MTNLSEDLTFRFFDPEADLEVTGRDLPHWSQAGTMSFITWRTWDSMPPNVTANWHRDRVVWLENHRIDFNSPNWKQKVTDLPLPIRKEYYRLFSARWQSLLDDCHGSCVLHRPEMSKIVADSLKYFDGDRYKLSDFVVMPNHVHLLVVFPDSESMLKQCYSWKHFTATQINRKLNRTGRFWEPESFDHLVRTETQWQYLREYIAKNPIEAKLQPPEYQHYSGTNKVGRT